MEKFVEVLNNIGKWFLTEGLKAVIGLVCFWLFCKLLNISFKLINKSLSKKKRIDPAVAKVSLLWTKRIIKVIAFIVMLGILGIQTSGITAAIASLGLGIGLALQGSLSNFAGGMLILALKPYKVGDFIEFNNYSGTVEEIELFYTYLNTVDNKRIVIPNSSMSNSNIVNFSSNKTRRDEIKISLAYSANYTLAKEKLLEMLSADDRILTEPAPFIAICEYLDSSIQITIRFWSNIDVFWDLHFEMFEKIKITLDTNNISIPYQQLDVHLKNENDTAPLVKIPTTPTAPTTKKAPTTPKVPSMPKVPTTQKIQTTPITPTIQAIPKTPSDKDKKIGGIKKLKK